MEENNAYVYRHTKLGTSEVFYIGVGVQKKFKRARTKDNRNEFWHNVVNKHGFEYEILAKGLNKEDAKELEVLLISEYGRRDLGKGNLVNLTDGGDGTLELSEESCKKISEALRGEKHYLYGKSPSEEHLKNMSLSHKGDKNGFYGKTHSEETKEAQRIIKLGKKASKETTDKMSKSKLEKNHKSTKVIDKTTLEVFDSISKAARYYKYPQSTLAEYLRGGKKNKTNLILLTEYIEQNPNFKHEQ